MRIAVIGIGSNSLRMLVADRLDNQLTAVLRQREGLRVFASLNQKREISAAMVKHTCSSVELMRQAAVRAGADTIKLFATSAVRDASNQQQLISQLRETTGLELEIISGELEAKLSFIGATEEERSGMIDIGGGSTEIVIGQGENIEFACSLQAGAVRLFKEIPMYAAQDTARIIQAVKTLLLPYHAELAQIKTPTAWVGVGGTMTVLSTSIQHINWEDHRSIQGFIAKRADVQAVMLTLADMPLDKRQALPYIPPDRADIVVHGFAILLGCMEELGIERIKISSRTNLDGYLKLMPADGSK